MSLATLAEKVAVLSRELEGRGVVDPESPKGFRNLTQDDLACRARLLTEIDALRRMALGPAESLEEIVKIATADVTCVEALARYNIASHVSLDGTTPIHAVAAQVPQLDEETLTRLVRNCIVSGFFAEPAPGVLMHTPLSRLLRDPDFRDYVRFYVEEDGAASRRQLDALEKWRGSREPHHTGFHLANGEPDALFFPVLEREPRRVKQAIGAFAATASMPERGGWDQLRESPLWSELDAAAAGDGAAAAVVVVDVGGGRGLACQQIADATTRLRFRVQDLPETTAVGAAALPAKYEGRFEFVAHDFFTPQPVVEGARVYFLRKVLHDWPDHYCVRILRSLIPALSEGDRVVVCDILLPERAEAKYEQRLARYIDIIMLQNHNARERTEADWRKLFAEADPRFVLEFEYWTNNLDGLVKATWKP